jgi:hypothetical protein
LIQVSGFILQPLFVNFCFALTALALSAQPPYTSNVMSFAEIEAELDKLELEDLRRLALKSWTAFVRKECRTEGANQCDESDPRLLAALDEAIAAADATSGQGQSGSQVRARLNEWISK